MIIVIIILLFNNLQMSGVVAVSVPTQLQEVYLGLGNSDYNLHGLFQPILSDR